MRKRILGSLILGTIILLAALIPFRLGFSITWKTAAAQEGEGAQGAQNSFTPADTLMAYGDTVYNEITSDAPVLQFHFEGQMGDIVSITMTQGECGQNFDPYITLQSPDGIRLAEDDNTGPERSAKIIAYELPKSGRYTILASRAGGADGMSTGDFNLSLAKVEFNSLQMGGKAPANLSANSMPQIFELDLNADDLVRVGATSTIPGIDPYMIILDPSGAVVAADNDSAERRMPEIDPFIVPVSGTYRVAVFSINGISGAAEVYADTTQAIPVELNQPIRYTLSPDARRAIFIYKGRTDEVVSFRVRRTIDTFRPNMAIFRGIPLDNNRIASAGGTQLGTAILEVSFNSDGYYVAIVKRHVAEFGSFEFVAERS